MEQQKYKIRDFRESRREVNLLDFKCGKFFMEIMLDSKKRKKG